MTEEEYAKIIEKNRDAFEPWRYNLNEDKLEQNSIKNVLKRLCNAKISETAIIAYNAHIFTESLCVGSHTMVAGGAIIRGNVILGDHCSVNPYAHIAGNVRIGSSVRIAPNVGIFGFNHGTSRVDIPIKDQKITLSGIDIGDDVWIGANAVITDGVKIGDHSVIGAGAVVMHSCMPYSVVGGNPARVLKDRRDAHLADALIKFDNKVRQQAPELLKNYLKQGSENDFWFADHDQPGCFVRPLCDASEIAGMFDISLPGYEQSQWHELLIFQQDDQFGNISERLRSDSEWKKPTQRTRLYDTMIVNYALEVYGKRLPMPISCINNIDEDNLLDIIKGLNWQGHAWSAGDWVDCFASALYINYRYHNDKRLISNLFDCLDRICNPKTGLWGDQTVDMRMLMPVNGFYRLTRGTYAQFDRPIPYPEAAIDSILTHAADKIYFGDFKGNACNVLDVVHPLWLCLKQTNHRRSEVQAWIRERLLPVISNWQDGLGFGFDLNRDKPSLQGTEMWLSIIFVMANLLDMHNSLSYQPKGVHRLKPAIPYPI